VKKEKIRVDQIRVGDLISLTAGPAKPVFRVLEVGEATLFGRVKAVRVTVENPAGYVISKNLAARRPVKRAVEG
jgi:hypothetical protein